MCSGHSVDPSFGTAACLTSTAFNLNSPDAVLHSRVTELFSALSFPFAAWRQAHTHMLVTQSMHVTPYTCPHTAFSCNKTPPWRL